MLVTEEQAKKLWCPWARTSSAVGGSLNRDFKGGPDSECRCIASQCMAWHWEGTAEEVGFCGIANKRSPL